MSLHIDDHSRTAQPRRNACESCGANLPTGKHTGRKRQFCDDTCKDNYRRQLNFEFYGKPRKPVVEQFTNGVGHRKSS